MSDIVTSFNPATSSATSFTAPQSSANGALVFFNESNIGIDLTFADGSSMYLPAWYHRQKCGATGSVNVTWDTRVVLASSGPPMSSIIVEAFAQGEPTPADGPLVRQTNGDTTVTGGVSSSIVNTSNPAGTHIIDAAPAGDLTNAVTMTNRGQLILGDNSNTGYLEIGYPGSIQIDVGPSNTSGGEITLSTDVTGTLLISTNGPLHKVVVQGNNNITFDAGNGIINTNTVNFTLGSLTRISKFSAALTTTSTFFNHGLGVIPDIVLGIAQGVSVPTTRVWEYQSATMTSTQVKMTGASTFTCDCIAIKF